MGVSGDTHIAGTGSMGDRTHPSCVLVVALSGGGLPALSRGSNSEPLSLIYLCAVFLAGGCRPEILPWENTSLLSLQGKADPALYPRLGWRLAEREAAPPKRLPQCTQGRPWSHFWMHFLLVVL